jgi:hypothetical protein
VTATAPMTKGEALYLYMTWQQAAGRAKLERMLIDEHQIDKIKQDLGEKYIAFADWIQKEFLPSRRIKYNEMHKQVFGASMGEVQNYFPLVYDKKQHRQDIDLTDGAVAYALPSTMTGAIINRVANNKPIAINANALDVLMQHGQDMEEWNAYARLRKDMNALLSNNYFKNLVEASDRTAFDKFLKSAQIALRAKKENVLDAEKWMGRINTKLAGAAIAFRLNTAVKQLLSYPAFMAYSANPLYQGRLVVNLNPVSMALNYKWALDHLPGFRERVSSGVFGNEKLLTGGWQTSEQAAGRHKHLGKAGAKLDDFLQATMKIGMKPNQFVDAVASSAGSKAIYDYKKGVYRKQGLSEAEANEKALFDAAIAYNESQQSARDEFLAPVQKSETWWARGMTTFMNNNFGYLRKQAEGVLQIARSKRQYNFLTKENMAGGMSEEASKSAALKTVWNAGGKAVMNAVMYGVMLNTIWQLAEKILWATGDDDDEKKADLIQAVALSPIDNVLGGSMLRGISEGYEPKALMGSELKKAVTEITREAGANGLFSEEIALAATKTFIKFNTGINFDTWMNIYNGYEKGIREKGGATMAYQYFMSVPQSIRIDTAQKKRKDESLMEYIHRVGLAYDSQSRFEREYKSILNKYLFGRENDMTVFDRANKDAKDWKALKHKDNKTKKEWLRYNELSPRSQELEQFGRDMNYIMKQLNGDDPGKYDREKDYFDRKTEEILSLATALNNN